MYAEFLDARKQGRPIDAQARGCSILATNTSLAFRKCSDDLFALISGLHVINTFLAIERVKSFFHYSRNVVTVLWGRRLRRLVQASSA
jgi:hypothetical protein